MNSWMGNTTASPAHLVKQSSLDLARAQLGGPKRDIDAALAREKALEDRIVELEKRLDRVEKRLDERH